MISLGRSGLIPGQLVSQGSQLGCGFNGLLEASDLGSALPGQVEGCAMSNAGTNNG